MVKNQILCGESSEVMATWPDECIDLVVTSPPYDNLRDYNGYVFQFEDIAQQLYRIIKPGGVVVWVVADQTSNGSKSGTSFKQVLFFKELGLNLHDNMIYQKTGVSYPAQKRYTQDTEFMFILAKGKPKTFNPIKDEIKRWQGSWGKTTVRKKDGSLKSRNLENEGNGKSGPGNYGYKPRGSVWKISNGRGFGQRDDIAVKHPATFPEKLAHDHIYTWSNPGDIILDPMCGSGTTLKMAKLLGRDYLGVDISPEYCGMARNRVESEAFQTSLDMPITPREKPLTITQIRAMNAVPAMSHGGDRRSVQRDNYNLERPRGTSADYLCSVIARDRPDILERMIIGEFRSVRQAAIAAGIKKR